MTCNKKSKGCPFKHKKVTVKSQKSVNVAKLLKKRFFKRGAVIELRVLRANQIGRYQRFTVGKRAKVTSTPLCIKVGTTKPSSCS